MIEVILYTLTNYIKPLFVVIGTILILGTILYFINKRFDIHKKSTRYLGLFTRAWQQTNNRIICNCNKSNTNYLYNYRYKSRHFPNVSNDRNSKPNLYNSNA